MTNLAVPFRELINVVTLAQALIFASLLMTSRFRYSTAHRILAFAFLIFATVKFDQLYQIMGGLSLWPTLGFVFVPIQWLLTPALYFFVLANVAAEFSFKRMDLWHLLPATIVLIFWWTKRL